MPLLSSVKFTSAVFLGTFLLMAFSAIVVVAQQRCGTSAYMQLIRETGVVNESDDAFEAWMQKQLQGRRLREGRISTEPWRVRIVVHVVHNGEPVGVGTNISNDQILSQIDVLNKDFQRLNDDAALTPTEFQPVAGKMNIEFILADTDPSGNPADGITRAKGSRTSWTIKENSELKSHGYWPSEKYLNIWVCNLTDFYGFTQFPVSSLPGLENSSRNALTDGIIMYYRVFGSSDYGNFDLEPDYDKGRSTVHEMGHFLGLRHPWGDEADCNGTDYVADTPPQANKSFGCPTHPVKECPAENPVAKMFQNYMDFTNDACMNLFTKDQVGRMAIVLENSPRRSTLLKTDGNQSSSAFRKIFSPNGDGVNDFWIWDNTLSYEGCRLIIFDRFGAMVYDKTSYDNTWDGRSSNGRILEEEAYYYVIKCSGKADVNGGVRIVR